MIQKGEAHPFVGGMGLGEADAGCGGGITKTPGSGFKQASDDPNSRLSASMNPGTGLRHGYA